eukprot:TRINITY_DN180_c0_g1_i1.p1 TRINITY_DN180_c0_g1~~TRINITY_DN180_c0_g1_i1.p1  ORF type:complete len:189 (+),score=40.60 TRINITY_DN180_c0_g1_i1:90-656(+)
MKRSLVRYGALARCSLRYHRVISPSINYTSSRYYTPYIPRDPNVDPIIVQGKVLSGADQASVTGFQALELSELGKDYFSDTLYVQEHFGTLEEPIIVESFEETRIVGCDGGPGFPHDTLWHELNLKKPLVCLECGQCFKLVEHPLKSLTVEDFDAYKRGDLKLDAPEGTAETAATTETAETHTTKQGH